VDLEQRDGTKKKEYSQTMTTTNRHTTTLVLWALIWALALIGSAFVFKGNPIKEWIQLVLLVVGVTVWLWLWQSRRQARLRG
jgi:Flp pilus assembly protein TadB